MKNKLVALWLACISVLAFSAVSAYSQALITFDDLPNSVAGTLIPAGYQGLSWSNFLVVNAILISNSAPGYYDGMISPSNVAFSINGEIDARGTNFDFLSAYLTGAWNSNLNIEVQGFRSGSLLYDTTVVVSATSPTLFTFDCMDVDRLHFSSFGGEPAFTPFPEYQFVMDNMTIDLIPEPSSLLLTTLGTVTLFAVLRGRRG